MNTITNVRFDGNKLTNEMSEWLDSLLPDDAPTYIRTYFIDYSRKGSWGFRYPGSTRGHVSLDKEGKITGITFYKDTSIYDEERAYNEFSKFIGMYVVDVVAKI